MKANEMCGCTCMYFYLEVTYYLDLFTFKKYLLSILKDTILNFKSMIPCQFLSFLDQQDI